MIGHGMLGIYKENYTKPNVGGVRIDLFAIRKSVRAKQAHSNSCITKVGFTLIEISIVLVVIGLLAGGILAGKSLSKSCGNS